MRKDSPTCCKENFRVLLLLIVANKWKIHSLDIKSVFLQGNKIDREICLKPPVEAGTSKLWKLNISVYGLYDTLCSWYLSLKSVLLRAGATKCKFDNLCFFGQSIKNYRVLYVVLLMTFVGEARSDFNQQ